MKLFWANCRPLTSIFGDNCDGVAIHLGVSLFNKAIFSHCNNRSTAHQLIPWNYSPKNVWLWDRSSLGSCVPQNRLGTIFVSHLEHHDLHTEDDSRAMTFSIVFLAMLRLVASCDDQCLLQATPAAHGAPSLQVEAHKWQFCLIFFHLFPTCRVRVIRF